MEETTLWTDVFDDEGEDPSKVKPIGILKYDSIVVERNIVTAIFSNVTEFKMNALKKSLHKVKAFGLVEVRFHHNDSALSDEDVSYRFQYVPIYVDEIEDSDILTFYVDVRAKEGEEIWVTSRDLVCVGNTHQCAKFKNKEKIDNDYLQRFEDWFLLGETPKFAEEALMYVKGFPVNIENQATISTDSNVITFDEEPLKFVYTHVKGDRYSPLKLEYSDPIIKFTREYVYSSGEVIYTSTLEEKDTEGNVKTTKRTAKRKGASWTDSKIKRTENQLNTKVGSDVFHHIPLVKLRNNQSLRFTAYAEKFSGSVNACFCPAILPFYREISNGKFEFIFRERGMMDGKDILDKAIKITSRKIEPARTYTDLMRGLFSKR